MTIRILRMVAAAILLLAAAVRADAQDLVVNVSEEYGGYYRPNDWYPVVVSIQNQSGRPGDRDSDFRGRLSIESDSNGEREGAYDFVRDVEVPSGSVLRFTAYAKVREKPATQPTVVLRAASGKLIQTTPLNIQALSSTQLLMVTVSDEARNYYFPRHPAPVANRPLQRAFVSPRNLPEHWAAYDPIDILVFPGWPDTRIVDRNVQALKDWVTMGGTLVFLGGSKSVTYQNPTADAILPVTTGASRRCRIDGRMGRIVPAADGEEISPQDTVLISDAKAKPGTEILLDGSGGAGEPIPLIVREQHGRGQILFVAADLEAASPALAGMMAPYWLGTMPLNNVADWRYSFAEQLGKDVTVVTGRAARPPNVVLIILICVMYTLAVGPVNFYVLSKMGRIQLAWLTVPAIVFVFSGLIYAFGTLTKGGSTVARELTVLSGFQGESVFEERGSLSVFVPSADDFEFRPKDRAQTVADNDRWHEHADVLGELDLQMADTSAGAGFVFGTSNPAIESTDDGPFVRSWPLRTFDTARMEIRGPRELPGAIDANVVYRSTRVPESVWLEGEIANNTGLDFHESALVMGGRARGLGKFDSGDVKKLAAGTPWFPRANSGAGGQAPMMQDALTYELDDALPGLDVGGTPETDDEINRSNARKVVESILNPPMTGGLLPPLRGKLYFVGFAQDKDLTVDTNLQRDEGSRSIIVLCELNPVPAPGQFYVPPDLVQVNLQDYPEETGFRIDEEGGAQGITMYFDTEGMFSVELPFRHRGVYPSALTRAFPNPEGYDPALQQFTVRGWRLDNGTQLDLSSEAGIPRTSGPPILTPYGGRGWLTMKYERTDEGKKSQGGVTGQVAGAFSQARVNMIEFAAYGEMETE